MLSTNPQDDKNNHKVKLDNKNDEQRILFVYIYDFLKKNGATETAKVYLSEVDITKHYKPVDGANGSSAADNDSNSLPDVELPVNAPEGFLYEWWNVFWDIYSAKVKQNGGTGEARSYIEQQLRMRNNQRARLSSLHDGMAAYQQATVPNGVQMSVDTPNVNVDINNMSPQQRMKMNAANQTRRSFGTPGASQVHMTPGQISQ
ncbi:13149_t:CDS:2, partial [Entrophospora sp. SA101]